MYHYNDQHLLGFMATHQPAVWMEDAFLEGAATNESGRELSIPLDFLGKGKYKVEIILFNSLREIAYDF